MIKSTNLLEAFACYLGFWPFLAVDRPLDQIIGRTSYKVFMPGAIFRVRSRENSGLLRIDKIVDKYMAPRFLLFFWLA